MNEILLKLDDAQKGAFIIEENDEIAGKMKVRLKGSDLVVYSTKVAEQMRGKNIGKQLLETMVQYARLNEFKVIPICPFVKKQFERHPEEYEDLWKKD